MAKRINILKVGTTVPFADGGLKLSKSIKINEIEEHPDFKSLFEIDSDLLNRIMESIKENGFDASQPVHIWVKTDENGSIHYYLIDGYTRIAALKQSGHETVPYFEHKFENFDDAYKYVLGLQVNRRNLESSELLRNVSRLLGTDFVQNAEGKKSEVIAEVLGVSDRTVEKAISVSENADEETLAKIASGELSVNKAYKQEKAKKKVERNVSPDDDDISDSLEDNSGNPLPVVIHERKLVETEKMSPEEDSERTAERKKAYELGKQDTTEELEKKYSTVITNILYWAIAQMIKGKSPKDIYNDPVVSDLSPSAISNFVLSQEDDDLVYKLSME